MLRWWCQFWRTLQHSPFTRSHLSRLAETPLSLLQDWASTSLKRNTNIFRVRHNQHRLIWMTEELPTHLRKTHWKGGMKSKRPAMQILEEHKTRIDRSCPVWVFKRMKINLNTFCFLHSDYFWTFCKTLHQDPLWNTYFAYYFVCLSVSSRYSIIVHQVNSSANEIRYSDVIILM